MENKLLKGSRVEVSALELSCSEMEILASQTMGSRECRVRRRNWRDRKEERETRKEQARKRAGYQER